MNLKMRVMKVIKKLRPFIIIIIIINLFYVDKT